MYLLMLDGRLLLSLVMTFVIASMQSSVKLQFQNSIISGLLPFSLLHKNNAKIVRTSTLVNLNFTSTILSSSLFSLPGFFGIDPVGFFLATAAGDPPFLFRASAAALSSASAIS